MTLIGRNRSTEMDFPVDVASNVPYVAVRHLTLERGKRTPDIDIVITLGYAVGADAPPAHIALLVVVGATITDPVTHSELRPRVYDEWGPVPWTARPETMRITAPLSAHYWDAPAAAEVDLRVTAWRTPPEA